MPPYTPKRPVASGLCTSLIETLGGSEIEARVVVLARRAVVPVRRVTRAPRTATREDRAAWGAAIAEAMVSCEGVWRANTKTALVGSSLASRNRNRNGATAVRERRLRECVCCDSGGRDGHG